MVHLIDNIPEFADVVGLGNCCHSGGTAADEAVGGRIGGGTDDGNCPTLTGTGGNLGGVGGNWVHGGGGPDNCNNTPD